MPVDGVELIPDSAVENGERREEQALRSEANGSLPLSGHRSVVVAEKFKNHHRGVVKNRKGL